MIDSKEFDLDLIREGLEMFDIENKGLIDPIELKQTLEEMNLKDKNPFMYEFISSLCLRKDIKKKGGITFDEFINLFQEKLSDKETKKGIKNIFDVFSDVDNKIQMPSFYQIGKEIGDEDNYLEIKNLVEISKTGMRELDFDEFYSIMKNKEKINDNKKKYFYQNYTYERQNLETKNFFKENFSNIYNINSERTNQNNRYSNLEESTGSTEFKRYHRKYRGKKGNNEEHNNTKSDDINERPVYIQFKK